jgi:hypothetical protein
MRGIRIFKWTFLVIGLAFITLAVLIVINTRKFIAGAEYAQGTVVQMIGDRDGYSPVVKFSTAEGREISFEQAGRSNPPGYSVGEGVQVLYQPKEPDNARIDSFQELWLLPMIFGGMGLVFASIGGGIMLYGMTGQRRKEYLLAYGTAIETELQGVERNGALEFNGKNPWRIATQWMNPTTNKLRIFYSENLWFDPSRFVTQKRVTVLLDPRNPKRYYMDISFVPQLESDA